MSLMNDKFVKHRGAFSDSSNRFLQPVNKTEKNKTEKNKTEKNKTEKNAVRAHLEHADIWQQTLQTSVQAATARSLISYYHSPDIPGDRSINPYKGCEHGCIYCFARPSHAYLDLSPGHDFETQLFYKPNAIELLKGELSKKRYKARPITLGFNTDAYQPIEKRYRLTRQILEVLLECKHPVTLLTKSAMIERDIDIISELRKFNLVSVALSITTLDRQLAHIMEPRAAPPPRRLLTLQRLTDANIPVSVMVAPIIPYINDVEIEKILAAVQQRGANRAGFVMLRLPHEIKTLFSNWLYQYFPEHANKVLNIIRDMQGGTLYQPTLGTRMTGEGQYSDLFQQRFKRATYRLGMNVGKVNYLNTKLFDPNVFNDQMTLF